MSAVAEAKERLLIASAAEWQLKAAVELLRTAMQNVKATQVMPSVTIERISNATTNAMVALTQVEAVIKRMP